MPPRSTSLPEGILEETSVSSATTVAFLEGPAADARGSIFFSDIANNRIYQLSTEGSLTIFREPSGRANGNVFDQQGRLITCEGAEHGADGNRRVTRTDLSTGAVAVLADAYDGRRLNSPNDVVVDRRGFIYFTDPCYGDRSLMEMEQEGVYRIDPDGVVTRIIEQPAIGRPNGIAVSPDDETLYIIDAHPVVGGNRKVWAFKLNDRGEPSEQREVFDFAPGRGGDGMEVDREGRLYVCAGIHQPRGPWETDLNPPGVYVIGRDGTLLGRIPIPEDVITNCCFGGPDLRTLYVTAGKTLFSIRMRTPGYHVYPEWFGPLAAN